MNKTSNEIVMTPAHCRAARGLLNWSQQQLADRARVSRATVAHYETGTANVQPNNVLGMQRALEEAGIEFILQNGGGPGIRLRHPL
jgi:transcriptional regulator with XRE-family HTH domain